MAQNYYLIYSNVYIKVEHNTLYLSKTGKNDLFSCSQVLVETYEVMLFVFLIVSSTNICFRPSISDFVFIQMEFNCATETWILLLCYLI